MRLDFFQALTIINSIVLAILPIAFFKRQKLQDIKFNEIMELNIKTHDITQRADKSVKETKIMDLKDFERLDYLISRYKKHSVDLSVKLQEYKDLWNFAIEKSKKKELNEKKVRKITNEILDKSATIRELADKLLK